MTTKATQDLDDAFGPGRPDDMLAAIIDLLTEILDELKRQGEPE